MSSNTDTLSLNKLFEYHAKHSGKHCALATESESITYDDLNKRANRLAREIRARYRQANRKPMPAGTLIAIYFDRGVDMVVSMLAIIKAGGAYVPISPAYPAARTAFILQDTRASLILTEEDHRSTLSAMWDQGEYPPEIVAVDRLNTARHPTSNLSVKISVADLAYVIYTSGTTGRPKGALIEQQGIISMVHNVSYIDISPRDVFIHLSDPSFDAATFELWGALTQGATLVIPSKGYHSPESLAQLFARHKVSILFMKRALFDSLFVQKPGLFSTLRYLLVGGEALTADFIRDLMSRKDRPERVLNVYGPTEGTTFTTTYDCAKVFDDSVPIGKSIEGRRLYVLDDKLQPVTAGKIGELYIAGTGVARGYLNRPELTAERFISNPFVTEPDEAPSYSRLYKTGDLVRYLPDGDLAFNGRSDCQVKIRGYRI